MSRIHDIQYIDRNVIKYRYIILLLHPQSLVHTIISSMKLQKFTVQKLTSVAIFMSINN